VKFSMIFEAQLNHPTPEHERQVILDSVDQAVLAEELGFDRIWAVEHHGLKWYAHMSAPEIFLTWVAARTTSIRIGHGVVCLPFNYNHPVRVAERAAMLDLLSNGRLDLGGGRGATAREMSMCGVDPETTYAELEESLRIIAKAWLSDELEWDGPLLSVGSASVLPRPVQTPHPPLFLACSRADTVRLAADYGVGALVLGFAGIDETARMRKLYDDARAQRDGSKYVSTVVNDHFAALCPTIVLDDRDAAVSIGARGQRFFAEGITHWYGNGPAPVQDTYDDDNLEEIRKDRERLVAKMHEAEIPLDVEKGLVSQDRGGRTFNVNHAYGTADDAIKYVAQLAGAGVDEVMCLIQMGTVPQDVCLETIRQWGTKVIPQFR
jgi:alkanesulfonate monooxygenase SsuD/methylene tetrahydromethanopterin reductase-like flavin-dependent oxidoreductase (luciferase family)